LAVALEIVIVVVVSGLLGATALAMMIGAVGGLAGERFERCARCGRYGLTVTGRRHPGQCPADKLTASPRSDGPLARAER